MMSSLIISVTGSRLTHLQGLCLVSNYNRASHFNYGCAVLFMAFLRVPTCHLKLSKYNTYSSTFVDPTKVNNK